MDVGIFKASNMRLITWIVVPPLLITVIGLSSFAMKQRAEWRLKETKALSNVLPDVMHARKNVQNLYTDLGLSEDKRITTGDQLIALLEEKARGRSIELKRTQILDQAQQKGSKVSSLRAMMDATGEIPDFQLFLNDVKSAYPLVSVRSINLSQGTENMETMGFDLKVVFELLLVGDVMQSTGGLK